jgi:hypothetical protein
MHMIILVEKYEESVTKPEHRKCQVSPEALVIGFKRASRWRLPQRGIRHKQTRLLEEPCISEVEL